MKRLWLAVLIGLLLPALLSAQPQSPVDQFRRANENAANGRLQDALLEYARIEQAGVRAPALYWNWAQVATATGRQGEALWALLRAGQLLPSDPSVQRETERVRQELGLDPAEASLGLLGDLDLLSRRGRFDLMALACVCLSLALLARKRPAGISPFLVFAGLLLLLPFGLGRWRDPRGVVIQKEAPLLDSPRIDAVTLAHLREGEAMPILGEEGEYLKVQDASGARGFALKSDVRKIGRD